jgi:hypothetical protein
LKFEVFSGAWILEFEALEARAGIEVSRRRKTNNAALFRGVATVLNDARARDLARK